MGVLTGSLGAINSVSNVRNWSIEDTSDPKLAVASSTRMGTARRAGVRDWSGSINVYGAAPSVMPGDIFNFIGYRAPTTGVAGSPGVRSAGDAIVESVAMNWNWTSNDILNTTITLSGAGALVHSSGAAVTDAAIFDQPTPCGLEILWAAPGDDLDDEEDQNVLADVSAATLTITRPSQSYVSSSTACWTRRVSGGAVDWTCAITQYNESGLGPCPIADDIQLYLPVSATAGWKLKWAHLQSITGVVVDIETNAVIQQTLNFAMQATYSGAIGSIVRPGASVAWWPAA